MAYHIGDWVPGTCVPFGSLDFVIAIDGTLERIQTLLFGADIGIAAEVERDIRPVIRGDDVFSAERPHGFDSAQLER